MAHHLGVVPVQDGYKPCIKTNPLMYQPSVPSRCDPSCTTHASVFKNCPICKQDKDINEYSGSSYNVCKECIKKIHERIGKFKSKKRLCKSKTKKSKKIKHKSKSLRKSKPKKYNYPKKIIF